MHVCMLDCMHDIVSMWLEGAIPSRGYKPYFMLNSVEHETLNAHKYKKSRKSTFLGSDKPRMLFFPDHKC